MHPTLPALALLFTAACAKAPAAPAVAAVAPAVAPVAAKPVAPPAESAIAAASVDAVNALVPAALQAKIKFAVVVGHKQRHVGLLPAGWSKGFMPGSVKPPESADLGFTTEMAVDSNCDGACAAKDWGAVVAKVEFDPHRFGSAAFASDEAIAPDADGVQGRIATAKAEGKAYVGAAFWKAGAERYSYCRATLDGNAVPALAAFAAACRATVVREWH